VGGERERTLGEALAKVRVEAERGSDADGNGWPDRDSGPATAEGWIIYGFFVKMEP